MTETRVVDEETGGAKGTKPCQLAWAPADALRELGEVYGYGAEKYDAYNFRLGYKLSLTLNALWRHVLAFQGGEDNDAESGHSHMAHAAWHALNAIQLLHDHPEMDDRWKPARANRVTRGLVDFFDRDYVSPEQWVERKLKDDMRRAYGEFDGIWNPLGA